TTGSPGYRHGGCSWWSGTAPPSSPAAGRSRTSCCGPQAAATWRVKQAPPSPTDPTSWAAPRRPPWFSTPPRGGERAAATWSRRSGRSRRCAMAGSSPSRPTRSSAPGRGSERPRRCWRPPSTPRPAAPDRPRVAAAHLTRRRLAATSALLALVLGVSLVAATLIGPVHASLLTALGPGGDGTPDFLILFRTRLPRVLLAPLVACAPPSSR